MAEQRRETFQSRKRAEGPVPVELTGQDVDHMAPAMRRSTSDHMASAILRSLHGTGQDVDHEALALCRSTSDHMAIAIHRSFPGDVDHVASAMHRSTSDHMAPAILRSLPGDVTGHYMTGPLTGHRLPVTSQGKTPVTSQGKTPDTGHPVPGTGNLASVIVHRLLSTDHQSPVTSHSLTGPVN
ncbi:hypothetical protein DPMN_136525 [Dreissena polymorpha]|uniref:Uncharacterized protein n=1 Tax=Dreissena polymorpha TaxID=45954 RepID=A0A9D4JFL8_DREPO|nr:hypothetical protein DPMN_136525 [Dreissena polymorpha]